MKGNDTEMTVAERTKLRAYRILGHGGIQKIADDLGENRPWISMVLNGKGTSAPLLERINRYLDEHEKAEAA